MKDRRAPVHIRPFVTAGEVWVRPDGSGFDIVPIEVFRFRDGRTGLRIGRNLLFFAADGTYDGVEGHPKKELDPVAFERGSTEIMQAYEDCLHNHAQRPPDAHYPPGTSGYEDETAIWPPEPRRKRTSH